VDLVSRSDLALDMRSIAKVVKNIVRLTDHFDDIQEIMFCLPSQILNAERDYIPGN
jgi:hypothetical protein